MSSLTLSVQDDLIEAFNEVEGDVSMPEVVMALPQLVGSSLPKEIGQRIFDVQKLHILGSLPKEICERSLAFKFHVFTRKKELKQAVDKYLQGDADFQDIKHWDVSQVKDFSFVFHAVRNRKLRSFQADLSLWNVSNATKMNGMFYGCEHFNSDLSRWNVGNV